MRAKIAALALALAITHAHAGDNSAKILFAGLLTGIIFAASMDANKPPAPVVYVPTPPPPPRPTARSKYLEACQAYGFSGVYCVSIWEGKSTQAAGS